jgi:hypothetical protein
MHSHFDEPTVRRYFLSCSKDANVNISNRVTRLGEFSTIRKLFTFENYKSIPHFRTTFFFSSVYALILTKMGWATFGAIFLQTMYHLVILILKSYLFYALILTKNGLGYILAIFLQSHLVTLILKSNLCKLLIRQTFKNASFGSEKLF